MKLSTTQKAVIALIIANTIWGAAAPIFKWSLESIPPFTLAFLRFSIAALLILPFVYRNLAIKSKHIIPLIVLSILGVTVNITFFFMGLARASSINAPIIASSGPIFLIFFAFISLREKITKKEIIGGCIGLFGVVFIVLNPLIEKGLDTSFVGNVYYIIAMFATVAAAVILKKIIKPYNPTTLIFWSFFIGSLGFLPFFWQEIQTVGFLPQLDTQTLTGILFGAFLSSALAYQLHYWAIKYMPVGEVGIFTYIDPVIAVVIAFPLLGETVTTPFFIGSFLVFLGIYIAEGRLPYHPLHKLFQKK